MEITVTCNDSLRFPPASLFSLLFCNVSLLSNHLEVSFFWSRDRCCYFVSRIDMVEIYEKQKTQRMFPRKRQRQLTSYFPIASLSLLRIRRQASRRHRSILVEACLFFSSVSFVTFGNDSSVGYSLRQVEYNFSLQERAGDMSLVLVLISGNRERVPWRQK